nr:EOG090X0MNX [Artemia franciscana]
MGLQAKSVVDQQQVRQKWADWRMIKDNKRRQCVKNHFEERIRHLAVKKATVLPPELQAVAAKEVEEKFPRDASYIRVVNRCSVTSRPRGTVERYRLSRIVWRHLADYNKLSSVQKAIW